MTVYVSGNSWRHTKIFSFGDLIAGKDIENEMKEEEEQDLSKD